MTEPPPEGDGAGSPSGRTRAHQDGCSAYRVVVAGCFQWMGTPGSSRRGDGGGLSAQALPGQDPVDGRGRQRHLLVDEFRTAVVGMAAREPGTPREPFAANVYARHLTEAYASP